MSPFMPVSFKIVQTHIPNKFYVGIRVIPHYDHTCTAQQVIVAHQFIAFQDS